MSYVGLPTNGQTARLDSYLRAEVPFSVYTTCVIRALWAVKNDISVDDLFSIAP
jgi:hypothetical protein